MAKSRRKKQSEPFQVRQDGGLCVVFVNTRSAKRRSVTNYMELLAWGQRCGVVTGADAERLERMATDRRVEAAEVARRAIELRARFGRIFQGLLDGQPPTDSDLAVLRRELASALAARHFARDGIGCRWVWRDAGGDDLDRMLWPVVMSMANVLSTHDRLKVRGCAGEDCDLFFIDRTPGSPRKWCSMKACGNKVKSRRDYYNRIKPQREDRASRLST